MEEILALKQRVQELESAPASHSDKEERLLSKTLLKPSEVAFLFSVSQRTVYRWVCLQELDGIILNRRENKTLRIFSDSIKEKMRKEQIF